MKLNTYCIYVHVNKVNGKIYIGQTHHLDPTKRWMSRGYGYRNCTYFWNAIQKYGWDNFEHIVLVEHLSLEMANIIEAELIKKYDSNNRYKGYNIEFGGRNSMLAESTKKKISKAHKGLKVSDETKRKISKATKGKNNPFYGKKHSKATRQKMKENHWDCSGENHYLYGKHLSEETKQKLREANIGENSYWYGKHKTEETKQKISMAITGQKRTDEQKKHIKENHADFTGKNHPLYGKHHSEETKNKLSIKCSTPVDMYDCNGKYIKTFHGMTEAGRETPANINGISRCCKGKQKTCGGYIWKYSEKYKD